MSDNIDQLLSRISRDIGFYQNNEEAKRQGIVLPVLAQLGWNVYNVREVYPEYRVGNGRIDYCLKIGEKKAVFIEVKRGIEELERHEKQLLEYSFTDGVELAVLTNGYLWWFYLPLVVGNWQRRKFFTIDIAQQDTISASQSFHNFLGRESIESGSAVTLAKSVRESQERVSMINQTIPIAWERILAEPDEQILDYFADKVESLCGYRPEPELIAEFLNKKIDKSSSGIFPRPYPSAARKLKPRPTMKEKITSKYRIRGARHKGVRVKIDGQIIEADSVSDLFRQYLIFIIEHNYQDKVLPILPFATSEKRYLIAQEPFHPRGNHFVFPVEPNGLYMEAHKDYRNALQSLIKFSKLLDLDIMEET